MLTPGLLGSVSDARFWHVVLQVARRSGQGRVCSRPGLSPEGKRPLPLAQDVLPGSSFPACELRSPDLFEYFLNTVNIFIAVPVGDFLQPLSAFFDGGFVVQLSTSQEDGIQETGLPAGMRVMNSMAREAQPGTSDTWAGDLR